MGTTPPITTNNPQNTRSTKPDQANLATQWLTNVSYYRLSAYWFPARRIDSLGNEYYCEHSTFTDAVRLYEADRKLRTLIHDGIERIEVTMRTRLGERLCVSGSNPTPISYQDPTLFRTDFNHTHWGSSELSVGDRVLVGGCG